MEAAYLEQKSRVTFLVDPSDPYRDVSIYRPYRPSIDHQVDLVSIRLPDKLRSMNQSETWPLADTSMEDLAYRDNQSY